MSKENLPDEGKQRYKGVENFLRRVAFNLGNTPSKTEVKIISCIPIDVTDLQQKIIQLEKQLEEAKANASSISQKRTSAVHTALCCSNYPHLSSVAVSSKGIDCACGQSNNTIKCRNCFTTQHNMKSTSLFYPDVSSNNQNCRLYSTEVSNMSSEEFSKSNCCSKNLFRKRKKAPKKKVNSQMVYYAQPNNYSPFNNYGRSDSIPQDTFCSENNILSRSYLSDVIRKQYNPSPIVKEYSNSSQFSSPVCRDVRQRCEGSCQYESDICSCCHGKFQNIDNYITNENYSDPFWTYTQNVRNNRSAYYDSSLYDLVPVKEKVAKVKKDPESKRREPQREVDIKCWPENVRAKRRTHPLIVNYYTTTPAKPLVRRVPLKLQNRREVTFNKTHAKRARTIKTLHEPSATSCVELGKVYSKSLNVHKSNQSQRVSISVQPPRNINAECSKIADHTECQTTTVDPQPAPVEDKTETTLNQIKSILQSVLAEVKTNSILKNVSDVTTKKDAIVQKELSQSNMQGSSLLQSFTYSPYDINPNAATCSRQLASGICYSGVPRSPIKCMPHYPLFVQHPARKMCTNCFRNTSYVTKLPPMKHATSAATNTEDIRENSKTETEKLIKEIYKSMALTMPIPTKDTSTSEYDDLKSTGHDYTNQLFRSNTEKEKQIAASISSIFRKVDLPDTSVTVTPNTTHESKLPTNESTQSQFTTDTDQQISRDNIKQYLKKKDRRTESTDTEIESGRIAHEPEINENATLAESDEDTDTSSVDSDEPVTKLQQKQKKGLFSKVLKLFKPRERNTKKSEEIQNEMEDESKASDSDDYQTVYSHKMVTPKQNQHNIHKTRPHSKIFYSKIIHRRHANHSERSPERFRRMPYMEQEYRRFWEEKLSFHEKNLRHSSEKFSKDTTRSRRPVYFRNYEARSAMVEPDIQFHQIPAGDNVKLRNVNIATEMTNIDSKAPKITAKGLAWLKKHKLGVHCGEQWKNLILEG